MRQIFKYELSRESAYDIPVETPAVADFLDAQMQRGSLCVWMLVDPEQETVTRLFHVVGTGHELDDKWLDKVIYLSTVQDGPYVWHVFVSVGAQDA